MPSGACASPICSCVVATRSPQDRSSPLRDDQKAVTRRRVLDGARIVFSHQGYGAAKIDDIAATGQVSRATLYLHFTGKGEILEAVSDEVAAELVPLWRQFDATYDDPEGLREWIVSAVEWYEDHRQIMAAIQEAHLTGAIVLRPALERLPGELSAYFGSSKGNERKIRAIRIEMLFRALTAICREYDFKGETPDERELLLDVLTQIWTGALGVGDGPGRRRRTDR
jgi:AcrR family transcriptional regulator